MLLCPLRLWVHHSLAAKKSRYHHECSLLKCGYCTNYMYQ
nr:MAG TPA: hypothetical protein [Caudoviricetes sp.]